VAPSSEAWQLYIGMAVTSILDPPSRHSLGAVWLHDLPRRAMFVLSRWTQQHVHQLFCVSFTAASRNISFDLCSYTSCGDTAVAFVSSSGHAWRRVGPPPPFRLRWHGHGRASGRLVCTRMCLCMLTTSTSLCGAPCPARAKRGATFLDRSWGPSGALSAAKLGGMVCFMLVENSWPLGTWRKIEISVSHPSRGSSLARAP
jgi:hypothetical protein